MPDEPAEEPRCELCGEPLDGADRFCTHCGAPIAIPTPVARARVRARRWRRRRRLIGVFAFVVVIVGLAGLIYSLTASDDSSPPSSARDASSSTTTTVGRLPAGPYKVTTGINMRAGPGASTAIVGVIELGNEVIVLCKVDGESYNGPTGPSTVWLHIGSPADAYVAAPFVATGGDLTNVEVIPVCKPA
jgi:hypothetical protein